ncbi:hypothetical protein SAMN04487995_0776 [Dyadobacter koreensis]|uniref:Cache domain-containing protein n=1 Tax=Dyadobacter koreensis TaxID=408657 RepID=A0A1H6QVX2_9BACT|nr:cache domain-containing protein [Dyadobacter koreensis]SEI44347.1 hypothetical protein SAMN04487995_0776 [Dyadobacter koreensis]
MKSFLPSREQIPFMVTLAILLSLGAMYYFSYLPASQNDVNRWKFRTLQNVNRNIQDKLTNGYTLLETYLPSKNNKDYKVINRRIQLLENFPLMPISPVADRDTVRKYMITPKNELLITRVDTFSKLKISFRYNFEDFIKPLLPNYVFDHYIVVNKDAVIYQTFSSGFDYSADSLSKYLKTLSGTTIKDKEFGGIPYKLFNQPVVCDRNTKFTVIGLITLERYEHEKSKLSPSIILLLITIFSCIVITFPIIKLYSLGKEDRLTITDALSSAVVSMVMISLLFFIFLKYNELYIDNKNDSKEVLAHTIESFFLKEIKEDSTKLSHLDTLMKNNPMSQQTLFGVGKGTIRDSSGKNVGLTPLDSLTRDIRLDRIFWMTASGGEAFAWKADTNRVFFPGNFSKRTYFQKITESNPTFGSKFYVDQVYSWIDGVFYTVLALPSKVPNMKVVAATINLKSLDSIKVPTGYTFAMTRDNGEVIYHSNKAKNLNENLLLEFSEREKIAGAIKTRSSATFKSSYFGRNYDVLVQPISMLPYHLVIMDDRAYVDFRNIDVYSFTFSMQFLLFIFFTIQILAVFFASSKRSLYSNQSYETSWIGPKISSHQEYIKATVFHFYIAILLSCFDFETVICRFYCLFFSISLLPVFLNLLFVNKYRYEENNMLRKYKSRALFCAAFFPTALSLLSFFIFNESLLIFWAFFTLSVLPIFFTCIYKRKRFTHKTIIDEIAAKINYRQTFTCLILSGMLLTNGLPIIFFFSSAFNFDQHLTARFKQHEFAKNFQNNLIKRKEIMDLSPVFLEQNIYKDALWINNFEITENPVSEETTEDSITIDFLNSLRIYTGGNVESVKDFNKSKGFDFSYFFNNLLKQVTTNDNLTKTNFRIIGDYYLCLTSAKLNFSLPSPYAAQGFFFWLTFTGMLVIIFVLLYGLINKIYSLNLPKTGIWKHLDEEILRNNELNRFVFLIKTPGADQSEFIKKIIKSDPKNIIAAGQSLDDDTYLKRFFKEIDLSAPNEKISLLDKTMDDFRAKFKPETNTESLIVIQHFEYNFRDSSSNLEKLKKLEETYRTAKSKDLKILILSTIHPSTLIDALDESEDKITDHYSSERWQVLLANFRVVSQRLPKFKISKADLKSDIYRETQYSNYINKLAEPAIRVFKEHSKNGILADEQSLSYKLQLTSYHFYGALWQSFSKAEKFMLYDLAEDGLVNSYDKNTLYILLDKGVVIENNGMLKIFSRGFRNYILTGLGSYEMEKLIEKINDNRNWNKIKLPLTLISIAIIGFLLSSQHEASAKLVTSLGALATLLPTIIKILSSLGSDNSSQKGK